MEKTLQAEHIIYLTPLNIIYLTPLNNIKNNFVQALFTMAGICSAREGIKPEIQNVGILFCQKYKLIPKNLQTVFDKFK